MQHPIEQNDPKRFSSEKESQYFDRKSARKDANDISRHISAFANASGGKLVIGIEDDGEITGFKRKGAHDIEDSRPPSRSATPSPPSEQRRSTSPTRAGRAIASSSLTSKPQQTESSQESATARSSSGKRIKASGWIASRFAHSNTTRTRGASRTNWQTDLESTTSTAR